eukprot:g5254.t1
MGVILKISTSQAEYFAQDTVEGTVEVEVSSKCPQGSRAHELKLSLVGRVRTIITETRSYGMTSSTANYIDNNDFLNQVVVLGSFARGRIPNGTHTFPFAFSLPPDLLPSVEEMAEGGSASVRYSLKARLDKAHHGGLGFNGDPKSKLRLRILGPRMENVSAVPAVVGPASDVVRKCCQSSGTMTIGCRVNRLEVRRGQPIELNIVVRNDSPLTVNAMVVSIKQWTTLTAKGRTRSKKRTLASATVHGSDLAGAEPRPLGSARGQSLPSIAEETRRDVQRQLAAGGGGRCTITALRDAPLSMEIDSIRVKHLLCIKLKTTGFTSSPEISVPVHIRPPDTALPEARANLVEPQSSPPYAATVVEVRSNRADMPESVPMVNATVVGVDDMAGSVPAYTATVVQVGAGGNGMPTSVLPRTTVTS